MYDDTMDDILARLTRIEETMTRIEEAILKTTAVVDKVGAEVMPTIEALMENPMIGMLLNKGKAKR